MTDKRLLRPEEMDVVDETIHKEGVYYKIKDEREAYLYLHQKYNEAQLAKADKHRLDRPEIKFNNALEADAHNWDKRELDRPELREEIAKFLYDKFNTISKGAWEELPQFNTTRQWWLSQADQILGIVLNWLILIK